MKKRHLQTSFNYKFQQQQQAKQEYHKVKKIKEKAKKAPVSAAEELDYIKKLLNGEEVEDFGPEEKIDVSEAYWSTDRGLWITAVHHQTHVASQMSLVEYMKLMGGNGYYR
jgi:hypothetical protein